MPITLAQPADRRRDRLANLALLRRLATYTRRRAGDRALAVLVASAAALASDHRATTWLWVLAALAGLVLNVAAILATQTDVANPLLRRYEAHLARTEGYPTLNLPALVECLGAVFLAVGAAWAVTDLPAGWRLAALAAAAVYAGSLTCSLFDDNAWYNPEVRAPRWQEIDRLFCGVQVAALILLAAWWAPWTTQERLGIAVIAGWSVLPPLRVGATQRLVCNLEPLVEQERQLGTGLVVQQVTESLLPPLTRIARIAEELGPAGERVAALAAQAAAGLRSMPDRVAHAASQSESEELNRVAARLVTLAEAAGREMTLHVPEEVDLGPVDVALAGLAMRDLVGNAVTAGARRIHLELRRLGPQMLVVVVDDAPPMPVGAWKSPGSSSAALEARLRSRGGALAVDPAASTKTVTAVWRVER